MKIGYCRVSTEEQNPDLQLAALKSAGCEKIFTDKASGATTKRPQLKKCLDFLSADDVLTVWKMDRLGRSLRDLIMLMDNLQSRDIGFCSLTESIDTTTPTGRAMWQMVGVLAELERSLIKERTKAGRSAAMSRGVKMGRKPKLSPQQIHHAKELVEQGKPVREIARLLNVSLATLYRQLSINGYPIQYRHRSGFTLIELSIVLVIIGLIVGGVLAGRDLIRAAEIRSSVSQIEKIDAAVNTFKIKYNALPGDILAVNASAFGFTLRSGAAGHGDGNGLLKGCDVSGVANDIKFGCEVSLFWHDLSDAGIITGHFIGTDQCCDNNGALTSPNTMDDFLPASKLGSGVYINAWGLSGNTAGRTKTSKHYYQFFKSFSAVGNYTGVYITPSDAQNIDTKMDDGLPLTGKVFSQWFNNIDYCDGTCTQLQSVSTKACASNITNSPTSTYNVATIIVPACIIEINTSW